MHCNNSRWPEVCSHGVWLTEVYHFADTEKDKLCWCRSLRDLVDDPHYKSLAQIYDSIEAPVLFVTCHRSGARHFQCQETDPAYFMANALFGSVGSNKVVVCVVIHACAGLLSMFNDSAADATSIVASMLRPAAEANPRGSIQAFVWSWVFSAGSCFCLKYTTLLQISFAWVDPAGHGSVCSILLLCRSGATYQGLTLSCILLVQS